MRFLTLTCLLLSLGINLAFAQEDVLSFKNVREGKSFYSKNSHEKAAKKALKQVRKEDLINIYNEALSKQVKKNLCAYTLNSEINKRLQEQGLKLDLGGLIYVLREENEVDDVVAKILLTANEVKTTRVELQDEKSVSMPSNSELTDSQIKLLASFNERASKASCFDQAYSTLYSELLKLDKKMKGHELAGLTLKAYLDNKISLEAYGTLEQARINELNNGGLSLAIYQQKLKTLRTQYPLRDLKEKSNFVTLKVKKTKSSHRQLLFEQYTDLQIIMMGNVIKKLRARLEYDNVEISGYRNGVLQETIPLDPMERFRFAIKALRKEMSLLTLNTFFNGRSPDYMSLMTASYELGIIPASELEMVASLEEVWNPKKTFWDKAGIWIKTFSSIATIVIPPPYGFIPALVIVVIEATVGKSKDTNQIDPTVLF